MTYRILNPSNLTEQGNPGIPISSNPIRLATKYSDQFIKIGSATSGQLTQRDSSASRIISASSLAQSSKPVATPNTAHTIGSTIDIKKSKQADQESIRIKQKLDSAVSQQNVPLVKSFDTQTKLNQLPQISKSSQVHISESKLNPEYGSTIKKQQTYKLQFETPTRVQQSKRMTTEPSYSYGLSRPAFNYNYKTINQEQKNNTAAGPAREPTSPLNNLANSREYVSQSVTQLRQVTPVKEILVTPKKQLDSDWNRQKLELDSKIQELNQLNMKINEEKEDMKVKLQQDKFNLRSLQEKNSKIQNEYFECQNRENSLREKVMMLERQILSTRSKGRTQQNFEDVLKGQLEETQKFKEIIEEKCEEITRLHQHINATRRSTQEAINDANVQKLKCITEKKAWEQLQDITMLNKDNEIKRLKHALQTMESKLQVAINENKTKDQFIQQHLIGRAKTIEEKDYINQILSRYQTEVGVSKLSQKLLEEQQEIERLQTLLNKN